MIPLSISFQYNNSLENKLHTTFTDLYNSKQSLLVHVQTVLTLSQIRSYSYKVIYGDIQKYNKHSVALFELLNMDNGHIMEDP